MEKSEKNKPLKIVLNILLGIFVFFCAIVAFFNFTHSYYVVVGPSMSPTLNSGIEGSGQQKDAVFVSKIKSYTRGDIIVINKNYGEVDLEEKDVIKRLIAIEGDKIKIELIDGYYRIVLIKAGETEQKILEENYLSDYSINSHLYNNFTDMVRVYGLEVDQNGFITIAKDSIFYVGDNRARSSDCSIYGPKNKNAVIGKVDYIIYNNKNIYGQVLQQIFGW